MITISDGRKGFEYGPPEMTPEQMALNEKIYELERLVAEECRLYDAYLEVKDARQELEGDLRWSEVCP